MIATGTGKYRNGFHLSTVTLTCDNTPFIKGTALLHDFYDERPSERRAFVLKLENAPTQLVIDKLADNIGGRFYRYGLRPDNVRTHDLDQTLGVLFIEFNADADADNDPTEVVA